MVGDRGPMNVYGMHHITADTDHTAHGEDEVRTLLADRPDDWIVYRITENRMGYGIPVHPRNFLD